MLIEIEKSDFEKVVDFGDHFFRSFSGVDFGVDFRVSGFLSCSISKLVGKFVEDCHENT